MPAGAFDPLRAALGERGQVRPRPDRRLPRHQRPQALSGLTKRNVMRSLSPMASYLAWSKAGLGGWPAGALRRVGGSVQTPNGWSLVSFGLALISEAFWKVKPAL